MEVMCTKPAEFAAYIKSESVKWAAVVEKSGIHIE